MTRTIRPRFRPVLEVLDERTVPSTFADVINAQGTTSVWNYGVHSGPPVGTPTLTGDVNYGANGLPDTFGWAPASVDVIAGHGLFARVDLAGREAAWLHAHDPSFANPTTTSGSISEVALPGGGARVTVNLHAHNAITWAITMGSDFSMFNQFGTPAPSNRVFGATPDQLVAGAAPALANSDFQVVYNAPAVGAPVPDFVVLLNSWEFGALPGYSVSSFSFHATAQGTTPAGQQATLTISEVYLGNRTPNPVALPPYQGFDIGWTAQVAVVHTHGWL